MIIDNIQFDFTSLEEYIQWMRIAKAERKALRASGQISKYKAIGRRIREARRYWRHLNGSL